MSKRSTARNKKDEQEILSSLVNPSGEGEDPAVRAALSDEFVQGSNQQAVEIGLALQRLIRGQNSILENQDQFSEQLSKLRDRMNAMDRAAERWETDREGFVNEVLEKAEKLRATGEAKDRIIAQGSIEMQNAVAIARAEQATEHLKFERELASMPKVTIVSPGELVMVIQNKQQVAKIMNEVVKIKHKKWILPVGKPVEVPQVVAQVLESRRRTQEENEARSAVLSRNLESSQLDEQWKKINSKYNSTTDTVPLP